MWTQLQGLGLVFGQHFLPRAAGTRWEGGTYPQPGAWDSHVPRPKEKRLPKGEQLRALQ